MKPSSALVALLALTSTSCASPVASSDSELVSRNPEPEDFFAEPIEARDSAISLEKRRGGGGRGGGGGGGSKGGSSSSGSSSSGSRGGGGGGGGGGGTTGTRGYSTPTRPTYGGGTYAGGARSSYAPGTRSPIGSIAPFLLLGGGLGLLAASWPYGAYTYPWHTPYHFRNSTNNNQNQTLPVECLCSPYNPCGCDDTGNSTYIDSLILPNGSSTDKNVATIQNVNGTQTVVLNGTLPNGTDSTVTTTTTNAASGMYMSDKAFIDALLVAGVIAGSMLM